MTDQELFAVKEFSWVVAMALSWISAARGHTTFFPKFDLWFWGLAFFVSLVLFVIGVVTLVMKAR